MFSCQTLSVAQKARLNYSRTPPVYLHNTGLILSKYLVKFNYLFQVLRRTQNKPGAPSGSKHIRAIH